MIRSKNLEVTEMQPVEEVLLDTETDMKNPLVNPLIVKTLFEIMPFNLNEFKNFRLVSKLWWEITLPTIRENVVLCLTDRKPEGSSSEDNRSPIESYIDWLNLSNDPYQLLNRKQIQNYVVRDSMFHVKEISPTTSVSRPDSSFWRQAGWTMTNLKLSQANFNSKEQFFHVVCQLTPNLTHLSLEGLSFKLSNKAYLAPPCWNDSFRQPASLINKNLKNIDITLPLEFEYWIGRRGSAFCWVDFLSHFPNLKVLRFYTLHQQFEWCQSGYCAFTINYMVKCLNVLRINISKDFCSELTVEVHKVTQENGVKLAGTKLLASIRY